MPQGMTADAATGPGTPTWRTFLSGPASVLVIIGTLVTFTLVGLMAPGTEEPGVATERYRRAAYWSCADLLSQRVGPSFDLEFPGEGTASISNRDQVWDVSGRVDIVSGTEPAARVWSCTVTHENGNWRGRAVLE